MQILENEEKFLINLKNEFCEDETENLEEKDNFDIFSYDGYNSDD
jgi:hypothetical protein